MLGLATATTAATKKPAARSASGSSAGALVKAGTKRAKAAPTVKAATPQAEAKRLAVEALEDASDLRAVRAWHKAKARGAETISLAELLAPIEA